ncbi:MAG: CooT family nickel-binding protein [Oscillospiraceae bacterium]|nr:CooT family nickel-binding protein [Oscillospiraceae bacterium]
MCLSKAYVLPAVCEDSCTPKLVMSNVSSFKVEDGKVILSDILGEELPIAGSLQYCDLVNGKLIIEELLAVA